MIYKIFHGTKKSRNRPLFAFFISLSNPYACDASREAWKWLFSSSSTFWMIAAAILKKSKMAAGLFGSYFKKFGLQRVNFLLISTGSEIRSALFSFRPNPIKIKRFRHKCVPKMAKITHFCHFLFVFLAFFSKNICPRGFKHSSY